MTTRKIRTALSRLKAKHGILHHPLTLDDFYRICETEGVDVSYADVATSLFFRVDGHAFIVLAQHYQPEELVRVAYHEFGHFWLKHEFDRGRAIPFGQDRSPKEIEADLFAEVATCSTSLR